MFWKSISYHTHAFLFLIFNALRCVFKNQVIFLKRCFFRFSIDLICFSSIEIFFKIFSKPLFGSIDRNCFSINRTWWIRFFLKKGSWLFQKHLFKSFSSFLSLSGSTRPHKEFFVVFLQISCKFSLSLSQYVYFTLPFALFFSFSCIFSWFLGKFLNYA